MPQGLHSERKMRESRAKEKSSNLYPRGSAVTKQVQERDNAGMINIMIGLPLEVRGELGGEGFDTRGDQAVLAGGWGAQLRSRGVLLGVFGWQSHAGWELFLFLSVSSSSSLFIERGSSTVLF